MQRTQHTTSTISVETTDIWNQANIMLSDICVQCRTANKAEFLVFLMTLTLTFQMPTVQVDRRISHVQPTNFRSTRRSHKDAASTCWSNLWIVNHIPITARQRQCNLSLTNIFLRISGYMLIVICYMLIKRLYVNRYMLYVN